MSYMSYVIFILYYTCYVHLHVTHTTYTYTYIQKYRCEMIYDIYKLYIQDTKVIHMCSHDCTSFEFDICMICI